MVSKGGSMGNIIKFQPKKVDVKNSQTVTESSVGTKGGNKKIAMLLALSPVIGIVTTSLSCYLGYVTIKMDAVSQGIPSTHSFFKFLSYQSSHLSSYVLTSVALTSTLLSVATYFVWKSEAKKMLTTTTADKKTEITEFKKVA